VPFARASRTVEWHLRKVYTTLGVASRQELRWVVANIGEIHSPA
jgi:hypothetical protein